MQNYRIFAVSEREKGHNKNVSSIKIKTIMKKIVMSVALVAVMILGTANVYAQTPTKKEAKKEQTATCKKAKADKKECKKECSKNAECSKPAAKAEKSTPKK